jgi:hypothetical protein
VLVDDGSGGGAEVTIGGAVELGGVIWNGERFEASMAFPGLPEYVRTARDTSDGCSAMAIRARTWRCSS